MGEQLWHLVTPSVFAPNVEFSALQHLQRSLLWLRLET